MRDGLRLMLVDHEPGPRAAGVQMLTSLAHSVVAFSSAATCIPHLSRSPVDAIVLELHLPQVGGLAFLRKLQTSGRRVPAVLTGVGARAAELREAKQLGAVFVQKPYSVPRLKRALLDVVPHDLRRVETPGDGSNAPSRDSILDHLEGRGLERLVRRARVPVLDPRVAKVQRFLTAPEPPSSGVLAGLLEADPRLSAALVHRANSVSFRGAVDIVSLPVAITRLGVREVLRMVLEVVLESGFDVRSALLRDLLSTEWERGVAAARDARDLCRSSPGLGLDPDEVFMATLMHDLGRPYLICALDRVDEPLERERVQTILDEHHARAGARLLTEWGMPVNLIAVARTHNGPPERVGPLAALAKLASLRVLAREEDADTARALQRRLRLTSQRWTA